MHDVINKEHTTTTVKSSCNPVLFLRYFITIFSWTFDIGTIYLQLKTAIGVLVVRVAI